MPSCSPSFGRPMLAKKTAPSILTNSLIVACSRLSLSHVRSYNHTSIPPCRPISDSTSPRRGYTSSSRPLSISSTLSLSQYEPPLPRPCHHIHSHSRLASSSSKWVARQSTDRFTREAKLQNLKSRAAFKLLQINEKYRLFRPGMTVVDLGYAPGSWSQVAIDLVRPGLGRVVGVDIIPVQPPKGVNGMQGDFLSPEVQSRVREFLKDESRGRMRRSPLDDVDSGVVSDAEEASYIDRERAATSDAGSDDSASEADDIADHEGKCVDVVLSDMSAPWEMNISPHKKSLSNPYRRMMNTTGNKFRDHAGSMDLCRSALYFSYETLKVGGHFVCKFYQGQEDKNFETQLKAMFHKVHREKPESSRSESREAFFVALKRLAKVDRAKVFDVGV